MGVMAYPTRILPPLFLFYFVRPFLFSPTAVPTLWRGPLPFAMIKGCDWTEEGSLLLVSEQGGIPSAAFIELVSNTQRPKEEDPHHRRVLSRG